MKKFLSMFLCLMLILVMLPTSIVNAATNPTIKLSSATVRRGDTVKVDISIENNPGIMAMAFAVVYDTNAFEYVTYERGYLTSYSIYNHSDKGWVSFVNVENDSVSTDGTMLTLVFKVKDSAALGEYNIRIAHNNPEKYGYSLNDCFSTSSEQMVLPIAKNSIINVVDEIIKGDVNNDGKINGRDCGVLTQYLNSWDVTINEQAADVTGDGKINGRDYALLIQYVSGWDVEFK